MPASAQLAELRCKCRTGNERSFAPVIGNDQHGDPVADVAMEQIAQPVDLALEARRDVVDGRQKQASG